MQKVTYQNSNNPHITHTAVLNFPPNFDKNSKYPAVIATHPAGGVKEQTAGVYAKKLALQGFVTLAYDASYQGESTGEPRQLENPYIRTEDVSAALDYLLTLDYVDAEHIGVMGVCAGGGYSVNAAINDPRIKAVATVSMMNLGQVFRNGSDGTLPDSAGLGMTAMGSQARTKQALGNGIDPMPLAPMNKEDAPNAELLEAWEYYHTERCQYPTAPAFATARSLNQIITYDAFNKAESFLTQPLLMVVGSEAGSKWMSEDLLARASVSADKSIHSVAGANHMSLYDGEKYVTETADKISQFFKKYLVV